MEYVALEIQICNFKQIANLQFNISFLNYNLNLIIIQKIKVKLNLIRITSSKYFLAALTMYHGYQDECRDAYSNFCLILLFNCFRKINLRK